MSSNITYKLGIYTTAIESESKFCLSNHWSNEITFQHNPSKRKPNTIQTDLDQLEYAASMSGTTFYR